jgi:hypothetical protein
MIYQGKSISMNKIRKYSANLILGIIFFLVKTDLVVSQYSIDGSISNGSNPISGIVVRLRQGGAELSVSTTQNDGTFSFAGLANGTYSVIPDSITNNYRFNPDSQVVIINNANVSGINFIAIRQYIISGSINSAISLTGINLSLTGHQNSVSIINSGNSYSFRVDSGYQYVITPSKTGYVFNPVNRNYDFSAGQLNTDQTSQNFDVVLYSIKGNIKTPDNNAISNITIRLRQGGAEISSAVSAGDGTYSFINLPNGTYTFAPDSISNGYRFIPDTLSVVINNGNLTGKDFTGIRQYTISGTVNPAGINNIKINISGHKTDSVVINSGSLYSFRVDSGYTYTITPTKTGGYTFNPVNKTFDFTSLNTDQASQDFTAIVYSITGMIKNPSNNALKNITIRLRQGGTEISSAVSTGDGTYSFLNLPNGTYTLAPDSISNGYRFLPDTLLVVINNGNLAGKDFTGIRQYTISGTVNPAGINNIKINISGHKTDSVIINSGAVYSFRVDSGYTYTITPTKTGGYTFNPVNKTFDFTSLNTDQTNQDFTAIVYSITGMIKNPSNNALKNITIRLRQGGAEISSAVSAGDGTYSFINLPNGTYTLSPDSISNGYRFITDTLLVVINNGDLTGRDFTGIRQYTISGTVNPAGINNIKINISGHKTDSVMINSGSLYSFRVDSGYTYTITPTKTGGYTFNPVNKTLDFTSLNADQTNQDFTAVVYSITGMIKNPSNNALKNIIIRLRQGGTEISSAVSAGDGTYSFLNLPNGTYTLAPDSISNGYRFLPDTLSVVINNGNLTGKDFTGIRQYTISGTVNPAGINNIKINISGHKTDSVIINSGTLYSFRVDSGYAYTVTPSKTSYAFTPGNYSYTNLNSDQNNQNFSTNQTGYGISGTLKNNNNSPIYNILVKLRQNGNLIASVLTNGNGYYNFTGIPNGTYVVVPDSISNGYRFLPDSLSIVVNNADCSNINFISIRQYTISGILSTSGFSNITITLSGHTNGINTINSGQTYSFRIDSGYTYNITPSLTGYTFTPVNRSYDFTVLNSDQSNQDFSINVWNLSGTIRNSGNSPIANITLKLRQNGTQISSTVSSGDGSYSFQNKIAGTYSILPDTASGYRFIPDSILAVITNSNITGLDLEAIRQYTIAGTVTTAGLSGILISLSGNTSDTRTINSNQQYSFKVDSGYNYSITPTLTGYIFNPSSYSYTNLNSNYAAQNFTASGGAATIRTEGISNPTTSSVQLNGFVQPNLSGRVVTLYFEWGETSSYGNTAIPTPATYTATSGISNTTFTYNLTGLTPGQVYHFRSKGVYSGGTVYGADMTFTPYSSSNLYVTGRSDIAAITPNPVQDGFIVNLNYIINNSGINLPGARIDYYISSNKSTLYLVNSSSEYRNISSGDNLFSYSSAVWPPASNPPNNNNTNSDGYYLGISVNGVLYWLQSDQRLVYAGCLGVTASNVSWSGNDLQISLTLKNYDSGHKITVKNIVYSIIPDPHSTSSLFDTTISDGTQISKAGLAGDVYSAPTMTWRNISRRLPPGTYYIKWYIDRTGCGAAGPVSDFYLWDITAASNGFILNSSGISIAINNSQSGPIDTALAKYFVLKLTDGSGNPVAGVPFTFTISQNPDGKASINKSSGLTNALGKDSTLLTLGHTPGNYIVSVNVPAGYLPSVQNFTGIALAGNLNKISGDNQIGSINTTLFAPFVVTVTNSSGKLIPDEPITFQITPSPGGGSLNPSSTITTLVFLTDSYGKAQVYLTLGSATGTYQVTASTTYPVILSNTVFTVTATSMPDLFASATTVTPAPSVPYNAGIAADVVLSGDPVSINNFYTQSTLSTSSAFDVDFFLGSTSPLTHIDSFRYYIGKQSFPSGINSPGIMNNYQFTIPLNIPNGTYYVYYWIDTVYSVMESSKLNNRGRIGSTITVVDALFFLGSASLQMLSSLPGSIFDINIKLNNISIKKNSTFEIGILYDSSVLKFNSQNLSRIIDTSADFYSFSNPVYPGFLSLSGRFNRTRLFSINDTFITLKSEVIGKIGDSTRIEFYHFTIDGITPIGIQNGIFHVRNVLEISSPKVIPSKYLLKQNYPNPFNPGTKIEYELPIESNVKIIIYNSLGEVVETLVEGLRQPGNYILDWNPHNLPSGLYFCRIQAGKFNMIRKMIYIR